jgi:RimJ/RimL family protein N-acetyltransferase
MTPPLITTDRLVLRAALAEDFAEARAMWGDADVVRYIGGAVRPPQDVWFALARGRGMWDLKGYGFWMVTDRATGGFLGECGFSDFQRGLDPDLSVWPEAGWAFRAAAWGRGIAGEAVGAVHHWLDAQNLGTSVCIIDAGNAASRRVAEKRGYAFWCVTELKGAPINVFRRIP